MRVAAVDAPPFRLLHQLAQLAGRVAQQLLQVADELVDEPLAVHFAYHISVIVIPQRPAFKRCFKNVILGGTSNTTLRILSVRGYPPPPLQTKFSPKKRLRIRGVPPTPLYGHSPEKSS